MSKNDINGGRIDNKSKGISVVNAMGLMISFGNNVSLVISKLILFTFYSKNLSNNVAI